MCIEIRDSIRCHLQKCHSPPLRQKFSLVKNFSMSLESLACKLHPLLSTGVSRTHRCDCHYLLTWIFILYSGPHALEASTFCCLTSFTMCDIYSWWHHSLKCSGSKFNSTEVNISHPPVSWTFYSLNYHTYLFLSYVWPGKLMHSFSSSIYVILTFPVCTLHIGHPVHGVSC